MKNKYLIILLLLTNTVYAADSLVCKISVTASYFTADALSDIYYINQHNEIVKTHCGSGDLFTYSNKNLGRPVSIDASNPMKVLVFYPDQQTIVILNNQLAELSALQLRGNINVQNFQPSAICKHTGTDHFWMYDELSRKLFRLDETGNQLASSEAFDQLFTVPIEVETLYSANDKVFISSKNSGVLVFDAYANFEKTIPVTFDVHQVTPNYIIGIDQQTLQFFDFSNQEIYNYPITGTSARLIGKSVFVQNQDNITIYNLGER